MKAPYGLKQTRGENMSNNTLLYSIAVMFQPLKKKIDAKKVNIHIYDALLGFHYSLQCTLNSNKRSGMYASIVEYE